MAFRDGGGVAAPSMLIVHLIRHAESTANVGTIIGGVGALLTPKGVQQATALGAFASRTAWCFDAVYSSTYPRAEATARLVCAAIKHQDIVFDRRLVEIDRGEWDGRQIDEVITADVREEMQQRGLEYRTPGGESMLEVGERMYQWLEDARATHGAGITAPDPWRVHADTGVSCSVAVFTHGHAIRCLLQKLFGFDATAVRYMRVDNTSVTTLRWNGEGWGLDCLNALPHMA